MVVIILNVTSPVRLHRLCHFVWAPGASVLRRCFDDIGLAGPIRMQADPFVRPIPAHVQEVREDAGGALFSLVPYDMMKIKPSIGSICYQRQHGATLPWPQSMNDTHPADAGAPAQATPYSLLGGEAGVRRLVDRFYDLMELEPAYAQLRSLHPTPLDGSRDKLFWYLSGWLGGPSLYIERFGHPRLRARHLPYSIGVAERDQWLACMRQAMIEEGVDERLRVPLAEAFDKTADWMRNRAG